MEMNTRKAPTIVDEVNYGVYVWEMPDGRWVADEDENWLCIASMRGDLRRMQELAAAARSFGIEEGHPEFLAGHRLVSDEEYETQKQRMAWGLIPDDHDIPALAEDLKYNGR